jgi:hypothetical protein
MLSHVTIVRAKDSSRKGVIMAKEVKVESGLPFASTREQTLAISFPTSPGFSTGATISIATARELAEALIAKLESLEAPPS